MVFIDNNPTGKRLAHSQHNLCVLNRLVGIKLTQMNKRLKVNPLKLIRVFTGEACALIETFSIIFDHGP